MVKSPPGSVSQFLIACVLLLMVSCDLPRGGKRDPRVVLISVDGLRAEVFLHPEEHGLSSVNLPNFGRIRQSGAHIKEVTTVFPSHTFPSHTSMVTGRPPSEHGIIHNRPFRPDQSFDQWYWWADSLKAPTLFHLAQSKGLVTAATPWPVSVNGPFDYLVPEIEPASGDSLSTLDLVRQYDKPPYLIEYFAFFGGLKSNEAAVQGFQRDINLHRIFKTVFSRRLPHLTGYHILYPDDAQHEHGRNHPEVRKSYIFADSLIGSVIDLITKLDQWPYTTLIVTGDHGHVDHHTDIRLNVLLSDSGLVTIQNGRITGWDAVSHAAGGAAFIRLRDPSDDYIRTRIRSILMSKAWCRLLESSDLPPDLQGYDRADFILLAEDGYNFPGDLERPFMVPHSGGGHGGDPRISSLKTTLFAMGRGIETGTVLESSHTTQTAVLIAKLLGLPLEVEVAVPELLKPED